MAENNILLEYFLDNIFTDLQWIYELKIFFNYHASSYKATKNYFLYPLKLDYASSLCAPSTDKRNNLSKRKLVASVKEDTCESHNTASE